MLSVPCWLCGDEEAPLLELKAGPRIFLLCCAQCLAQALETLTGYGFCRQLDQWSRMTAFHAEQRERMGKGARIPKGAAYKRRAGMGATLG